jgi:hypothetical protein
VNEIISSVGSQSDKIPKIEMTIHLEPMDRVKKLGDASVPWKRISELKNSCYF